MSTKYPATSAVLNRAFTLIELIIAVSILSLLAGIGTWISAGYYEQFDAVSSREDLLDAGVEARAAAQNDTTSSSTNPFFTLTFQTDGAIANGTAGEAAGYVATISPDFIVYENGEFHY